MTQAQSGQDSGPTAIVIEPATMDMLDELLVIEQACFSSPGRANALCRIVRQSIR
ncbi:MAG: hypothetical protein U0231_16725 [Nitrospiraceae bacterium]